MTYAHVPLESRTGSWAAGPGLEAPASLDELLEEAWSLASLEAAGEMHGRASVHPQLAADVAWIQLLAAVEESPSGTPVPSLSGEAELSPPPVDDPVHLLRRWTRLPMADLAVLVGVSRRTLYEWLHGVEPQLENRERISRLVEAIGSVADVVAPDILAASLRRHVSPGPGEALDLDELIAAVREFASGEELPSLERVVSEPEGIPVTALEAEELKAVLERRARPRTPIGARPWQPPEIMPAADDEA
jgi:transcriptional regulator with XRE-family HTH domain